MAEIVRSAVVSAVVQETVSQIITNLVQSYEEKEESNANRNLERLEMAHIRLEAARDIREVADHRCLLAALAREAEACCSGVR